MFPRLRTYMTLVRACPNNLTIIWICHPFRLVIRCHCQPPPSLKAPYRFHTKYHRNWEEDYALECASYKVLAQAKENKIIRSGFYLLGEQTLLCRVNARGLGHSRRNNGSLKPEAEGLLFSWNNPGPKAFLTFKNNFLYHVSGWVGR
jgi:hypothetical protein